MLDNRVHGSGAGLLQRRQFLQASATLGLGVTLAGHVPLPRLASRPTASAACGESIQEIINAALIAEQLATTFYYTGLTTRTIAGNTKVAGTSADPNHVSPNGDPGNVAYLQAALDQEQKHAQILESAGAVSPFTRFYFPAATFDTLGFTSQVGTYLWVLDHLETAFIGAYLAAFQRFGALGRVDLATLALRIMAVECQHRALYRVISQDDPADNVTLEVADFSCVSDAVTILKPFLTGQGFNGGATPAVPLPSSARTRLAIGKNVSS